MSRICLNLTFDDEAERAIRSVQKRIADAGITVRSLNGYHPHITLAVYDVDDVAGYEDTIETVARKTAPFPLLMESLGIFPQEGVAFYAPRMSDALFSLHRSIVSAFYEKTGHLPPEEYLLPDLWIPHCTLVGRLELPQMLTVLQVCQRPWTPIRGRAEGIGLRVYPETTDYRYYPLLGL